MAYIAPNPADYLEGQVPTGEDMTVLSDDIIFIDAARGTRIKLLPSMFTTWAAANPEASWESVACYGAQVGVGSTQLFCNVEIPIGYKATHVCVYGDSSSDNLLVYECSIADKTTHTLKSSSAKVNTEESITAVPATATNYLSIVVSGSASIFIYGGYVTIAKI